MEQPTKRTRLSKWMYRATLGLFTLLMLRFIRLVRDFPEMLPADAEGISYWIAAVAILSTPVPIVLLVVALFVRSGASLWLFGLIALQTVPNVLIPIVGASGGSQAQTLWSVAIILLVVLPFAAIVYLVQKEELRRP